MSGQFSVRFWGVRGSVAAGGPGFMGVGGNTTCVEVRVGDELIILDAGTGVFPLGQTLAPPVRASFLFSHYHWDHIQGFPFFRPAYAAGNSFTLYGPGASDADVEAAFSRQMQPPHFPVPLSNLAADLQFRALKCGDEFSVGAARVRTKALNHPQTCLGYRITLGKASFAFATDTEPPDPAVVDPAVVELADGVDLLVHDSQYSEHEYDGRSGPPRKGWGHSTYEFACRVARAARVKHLALFHHDPAHDDRFMEWIGIGACALFPNSMIAREGMIVDVRALSTARPEAATSKAGANGAAAHSLHAA
jgi:phosphoribosyl 1,2-cyclic phosphodiesterase